MSKYFLIPLVLLWSPVNAAMAWCNKVAPFQPGKQHFAWHLKWLKLAQEIRAPNKALSCHSHSKLLLTWLCLINFFYLCCTISSSQGKSCCTNGVSIGRNRQGHTQVQPYHIDSPTVHVLWTLTQRLASPDPGSFQVQLKVGRNKHFPWDHCLLQHPTGIFPALANTEGWHVKYLYNRWAFDCPSDQLPISSQFFHFVERNKKWYVNI